MPKTVAERGQRHAQWPGILYHTTWQWYAVTIQSSNQTLSLLGDSCLHVWL